MGNCESCCESRKNGIFQYTQGNQNSNKMKKKPPIINNQVKVEEEDINKKIMKQLNLSICKINQFKKNGTGFFCRISNTNNKENVYVLITNKSIISKNELLDNRQIEITFDNDNEERIIYITSERKIYSDEKLDITFIEIFPENDNINKDQFLELYKIEQLINNNENAKVDIDIYILQLQNEKDYTRIYGKITEFHGPEIIHNCNISLGGAILLMNDECKVIGINMGSKKGILLNDSINEFFEFFSKNGENKYANYIDCVYKIENGKEFNLFHDYNENLEDYGPRIISYYNEGKKKKKLLEENINIYIDSQPIKFTYKYKSNSNKINARFIFKSILNDLSFMFYDCSCLESINLKKFNSNNVINMAFMFFNCLNLKIVDLSSFKSNYGVNMDNIFYGCISLKFINFPKNNKILVTNLRETFSLCKSIETLDLTSLNTINVKDMGQLFGFCHNMKSINLSSFNTSNVKDMNGMFFQCASLNSINLSNFNTKNVVVMDYMFFDCRSMLTIDLSSFNTINVETMRSMFQACLSLKSINLSSFKTIKVINMSQMFNGCKSLEYLDLSSFETPNLTIYYLMFMGCKSLKSIDLSLFNVKTVSKTDLFDPVLLDDLNNRFYRNIFFGCDSLEIIKCHDKYILNMFAECQALNYFSRYLFPTLFDN